MSQTWRQRRLSEIEDGLQGLLMSLKHPGNPCLVCNSYLSLDQPTVEGIKELTQIRDRIQSLQDEPWAKEAVS